MQYKIRWRKREYNPSMIFDEFVDKNEWELCVDYMEDCPEKAYLINDWDMDDFYEKRFPNAYDYIIELMHELYDLFLLENK